jgi:hypothetical protein
MITQDTIRKLKELGLPGDVLLRVLDIVSEAAGDKQKGMRLRNDWKPKAATIEKGLSFGLTETEIGRCIASMRDWAVANANRAVARKADWDMTLVGWMRRDASKRVVDATRNGYVAVFDDLRARNGARPDKRGDDTDAAEPSLFGPAGMARERDH